MTETKRAIDKDKILKEAGEFVDLYFDLVWASRKPPLDADAEVWEDYWSNKDQPSYVKKEPTPFEIRAECLKQLRIIAEKHPEEYASLYGCNGWCDGSYYRGFYSGALAAFRWIIQSFDEELYTETANQWYPDLDTQIVMDNNELLRRKFELELSLAQMPMEHHKKLRIIKKVLDQCEEVLEEGFDDEYQLERSSLCLPLGIIESLLL